MARLRVGLPVARTIVTGGAGFIGGSLVESLLADGSEVTVLDDLSSAEPAWRERFGANDRLTFIEGDAADADLVRTVMAGHERVVHLASSTDIAGGFDRPWLDFRNGVVATEVVCEAMHRHGVRELWYASSGVVYGRPARVPTAEADGPLLPESHYAAAKLAGEAIVSGFAHLYEWRAFAFRFGNTVGRMSNHGVVHDLVVKLLRDSTRLDILGDGTPAKPYVAVADLVAGMRHAASALRSRGLTPLNVGPEGVVTVRRVAELVIESLGLDPDLVELTFTGDRADGSGWPGDTPLVSFETGAMRALGWLPSMDAEQAIRDAASSLAARYRGGDSPLVTSIERRAASVTSARIP